jgi:hypothetical protein
MLKRHLFIGAGFQEHAAHDDLVHVHEEYPDEEVEQEADDDKDRGHYLAGVGYGVQGRGQLQVQLAGGHGVDHVGQGASGPAGKVALVLAALVFLHEIVGGLVAFFDVVAGDVLEDRRGIGLDQRVGDGGLGGDVAVDPAEQAAGGVVLGAQENRDEADQAPAENNGAGRYCGRVLFNSLTGSI